MPATISKPTLEKVTKHNKVYMPESLGIREIGQALVYVDNLPEHLPENMWIHQWIHQGGNTYALVWADLEMVWL